MAATTEKKKSRYTRKKPIHVEMIEVDLPDVYDEPLVVPSFSSFPSKRIRKFGSSDTEMFDAIGEFAEPDVVEALDALNNEELTEFVQRWRKGGSLAAPKSSD